MIDARCSLMGVYSAPMDGAEDDEEGFLGDWKMYAAGPGLSFLFSLSEPEPSRLALFKSRSLSAIVSLSGEDGLFDGTS